MLKCMKHRDHMVSQEAAVGGRAFFFYRNGLWELVQGSLRIILAHAESPAPSDPHDSHSARLNMTTLELSSQAMNSWGSTHIPTTVMQSSCICLCILTSWLSQGSQVLELVARHPQNPYSTWMRQKLQIPPGHSCGNQTCYFSHTLLSSQDLWHSHGR